MTDKEDRERYERNFETLRSKLDRKLTSKAAVIILTISITFLTSFIGLIYTDLQGFKTASNTRHVEVLTKIGDIKLLLVKKRNTRIENTTIVQKEDLYK
jgi:hypothetical protein